MFLYALQIIIVTNNMVIISGLPTEIREPSCLDPLGAHRFYLVNYGTQGFGSQSGLFRRDVPAGRLYITNVT